MSDVNFYALRTAKQYVENFAKDFDEQLISDHQDAIECFDCEDFIRTGVDAYRWLILADQRFRRLILERKIDEPVQEKISELLERLIRSWHATSLVVDQRLATLLAKGFEVDVGEFRDCEHQIKAMVEFLDAESSAVTEPLQQLCDRADEEHRSGQTAEFI